MFFLLVYTFKIEQPRMNPWALGLTSRSRGSWRPLSWITWWWTDCQFSQWLSCHSIFKILHETCDALKNNTTREAVGWHDILCVSYQDVQEDQVGQVDRVDHVQRSPRKIPQSQIALNHKQTRNNWRNHWEKIITKKKMLTCSVLIVLLMCSISQS